MALNLIHFTTNLPRLVNVVKECPVVNNISVRNFYFLRFTDEVHFKGGALVGSQMLSWAAVMFAWNARAPNPKKFGKLAFFKNSLMVLC